jgi:hypothetical protein
MKKIVKIGLMFLIAATFLGNAKSYAQIEELGNMMAAGKDDAQTLLKPYITPAVNAFDAPLAGGWYNTAEHHKHGGFDITFTVNAAIIPKKYESFLIDNSKLNFLKLEDPQINESPTIAGEKTTGPQIVYNVQDTAGNVYYTADAFTMPQGFKARYIPAPMIQAGIGLIKGTDVMFRFLPNIRYEGNEIGLWGIGGRHDIKQWIPGLKRLPVLQLSIQYGYTKLHTIVNMSVDKGSIGAEALDDAESGYLWDDQSMKVIVQSQTANLLFAANLKVVCFYGGLGFVTTKTNLKLEGEFPTVQILPGEITPVVVAEVDPIDMEIKNQDGGFTKPRVNAGIRFKLAIVTLHFDYSWENYRVLTAGLGFSFR